jgi:hypothetical protein
LIEYIYDTFVAISEETLEERHKGVRGDGEFSAEYEGYLAIRRLKNDNKKFRKMIAHYL